MQFITPCIEIQQQKMTINSEIANTIINNAAYFELTSILGSSYDMTSYFKHRNGKRYCVIHTLFGSNYQFEFETNMRNRDYEWQISITTFEYKRQCILDYIKRNNCSIDYIYNIMDFDSENSSLYSSD